jgi:hypothetical protein
LSRKRRGICSQQKGDLLSAEGDSLQKAFNKEETVFVSVIRITSPDGWNN